MQRAAGRVELRFCPSCDTPIQKNGGCQHMSCACGRDFTWEQARPLRPCRRCHVDEDCRFFGRWHTCQYCGPAARAQSAALRASNAVAAAPLVTAVAGVAAAAAAIAVTVAAVPAATIGPLALAYHPFHRRCSPGGQPNPLAVAAASGAVLAFVAVSACAGSDSD